MEQAKHMGGGPEMVVHGECILEVRLNNVDHIWETPSRK